MATSGRIPAVIGMVLTSTVLIACSEAPLRPPAPPEPVSSAAANPAPAAETDWASILGPTSAPDGWQVTPCRNPVLLCVEANGDLIGSVERFSYPLTEVSLPEATLVEGSQAFLEAWVADFYTTIAQDRQTADRTLQFSGEAPEAVSIGDLPGLRYGYSVTHANGALFDRAVGYVTTDGEQIHVFTTGVISGDPSGSFSDEAALETFEPHFDTIVRGLTL
jgi:hypothetical protein